MSPLDRQRETHPSKAWGAAEERAWSSSPKVTFNTLSKADRASPKKENEGSHTKRPFGFVDRVKTLWRGPTKQTALEQDQAHALPEPENLSRRPAQANDAEDLHSRLATRSEVKSNALTGTALKENTPSHSNATDESQPQTAEQPTGGEPHTTHHPRDITPELSDQADGLASSFNLASTRLVSYNRKFEVLPNAVAQPAYRAPGSGTH